MGRAQITSKSTCLVIGAGPVGLLCAAVARYKGCNRIAMCDVDARRVQFALNQGFADVGVPVPRRTATSIDEEMANARRLASDIGAVQWSDGMTIGKFQVVFECTGVPSCVQTSIFVSVNFVYSKND